MNKLYYYKCTNTPDMPPYEEYNFAKGIAGFKRKLSKAAVAMHGMKYLGHGTEDEVYVPAKNSPGQIVRTAYNGNGNRY